MSAQGQRTIDFATEGLLLAHRVGRNCGIRVEHYLTKHGEGVLTLPDRNGLEFVIADTAKTNAKAKGQTPESLRVLDASVLEEIKKSGFIEKLKG
jgi:hypothetical protein